MAHDFSMSYSPIDDNGRGARCPTDRRGRYGFAPVPIVGREESPQRGSLRADQAYDKALGAEAIFIQRPQGPSELFRPSVQRGHDCLVDVT